MNLSIVIRIPVQIKTDTKDKADEKDIKIYYDQN